VRVERERARFSAWYELFPRSASPDPHRPGTFRDVEARLPYVAGMGFHILYLPPIHPIGRSFRKGRNNTVSATRHDVGSPWAIGSQQGGHKSINPDLGTPDDFRRLVKAARRQGLEISLDIAFQCSPDHPYVKDHPDWFRQRPDGSIRYAENPPKRYQDIYPLDFDTSDPAALWEALLGVMLSSIFLTYTGASITRTFFISAASFGALSLYGYSTQRDLSPIGSFLVMGLFGLILAMIVNMFLKSTGLDFAISAIGVLIFAGLTAWDTQKIKEMYSANDDGTVSGRKAVMGALTLYLDFINLFLFLLRFMGDRR